MGTKLCKIFKAERFNLVVLDVMLPEMDGFAVCEAIRLHNGTVPILFFSAKNAQKTKDHGIEALGEQMTTWPNHLIWKNFFYV